MEIKVLKENFKKALFLVQKFTSSKGDLPILSQVEISTQPSGITLKATNLDSAITYHLPGEILKEGEACVPIKPFFDFVSTLPVGVVKLKCLGEKVSVSSSGYRASFQAGNPHDFPPFPVKSSNPGLDMDVENLKEAIKKVSFSASSDSARPILTGIFWQMKEGRMVATDGYRLGLVNLKPEEDLEASVSLLLPAAAMNDTVKVLEETGGSVVSVSWGESLGQVFFTTKEVEIFFRLLSGEFPNFSAILPKEPVLQATLDREELIRAAKSASIFARDAANLVKFKFQGRKLELRANSPQVGENTTLVELEGVGAPDIEIAFNVKYVLDVLNHLSTQGLVIEIVDETKPALFRDEPDLGFLAIVMPVRVGS